jgi:hypothetical protein
MHSSLNQLGVRARLNTDGDYIQPDIWDGFAVEFLGRSHCPARICIDNLIDRIQAFEGCGRKHPDPTDSHESNSHSQTLPSMAGMA